MHEAELDLAESAAAEFGREMRGPQALVFHLLLERLSDRSERSATIRAAELRRKGLKRENLLLHKLAHPGKLRFEFWFGLKIPGHGWLLLSVRSMRT